LKLSEVFTRGGDRRKEGILLLTPSKAAINLKPYQGLKLSEVFTRGGDRRKEGILLLTPDS
jgi:hypothetical protein